MLKATLRSFLAHKGRMLLSGARGAARWRSSSGSLIFSDTLDHVLRPALRLHGRRRHGHAEEAFSDDGDCGSEPVPTLPARLADQVATVDGVADANRRQVRERHRRRRRNEPVGWTTGAPTSRTNWDAGPQSGRSCRAAARRPRARRGAARRGHRRRTSCDIGDTLSVLAAPGAFEVEVVGIAELHHHQPGRHAGLPRHGDRPAQAAARGARRHPSVVVAAEGVATTR